MNNESNKCGNCGTTCSQCGRPWAICKQDGGCKCNKCGDVKFCEYGRMANGCIREKQPGCPMQAVIPSVTVESIEGIKNLADCFVHVSDINTTFYIDDKHRPIITWAGPVDIPGYDMEGNPNNYRDQIVTDVANQMAVIYDKTGKGYVFGLVEDLDLQEQVDNKLDEMVEDGTLYELISQFMPYIYVEDYGAKGDGVTDDTEAFNDALTYAASVHGTIKLLNKTYVVSNLSIPSYVNVIGDGINGTTLKAKAGTTGDFIQITQFGRNYITLSDFAIDGNKENTSLTSGILIDKGENYVHSADAFCTFENLLISNIGGNGINNWRGGRENRFINIVIEYCDLYGLRSASSDCYFELITAKFNKQSGIGVISGACRFVDCKCFLNGYENDTENRALISGYHVSGTNNTFTSCEAQENYGDGFYIGNSYNYFANCTADANGFKVCKYNEDGTYADMSDDDLLYDGFHILDSGYVIRSIMIYGITSDHRRASNHQLQRYGVFLGTAQNSTFILSSRENIENVYGTDFSKNINYYANNYLLVNGLIDGSMMSQRLTMKNSADLRNAIDIYTGTDNTLKARITSQGTKGLQINNMNGNTYVDTPFTISLNSNNDGQVILGDAGKHYTVLLNARGLSFFGNNPSAQGLHYSDATDLNSAITLLNNLKHKLEAFGLFASQ